MAPQAKKRLAAKKKAAGAKKTISASAAAVAAAEAKKRAAKKGKKDKANFNQVSHNPSNTNILPHSVPRCPLHTAICVVE